MAGQSLQTRHPAAEWVARGLLAIVLLAGGALSVSHTMASATRSVDIDLASRLAPRDGRITGQRAQQIATQADATAADRRRADEIARLALQQDATSIAALAALGINMQIRGDVSGARKTFDYAMKLSRRDLTVNLWAIEDAVQREDIPGTLQRYDIALRTSRHTPDVAFPILSTAIADEPIRRALAETLRGKPAWGSQFVRYAASDSPHPQAVALLVVDLKHAGVQVPQQAQAWTIIRLVNAKRFDDAWALYTSVHSGIDRRRSRDPQFQFAGGEPSSFDWTPLEATGIASSIQQAGQVGVFTYSPSPSTGGALLQQSQLLPAGRYRLHGTASGIDQPPQSQPYWTLRCSDGRELGRVPLSGLSDDKPFRFSGEFVVPPNCPMQQLTFVVRAATNRSGMDSQIHRIQLAPVP